ncbi:MAG: hypothetical protein E7181_03350 [Erysipelotrichaceae bacterium]|nr:hypothetical protein [Erysipelotrichaceae bacterium]
MDKTKKHYMITAITLGCIAAVAGGIIGLTNMITKDRIIQNEKNKINQGITAIYGDNITVSEEKSLSNTYKYVQYYYEVKKGDELVGQVFRTSGSNMYGKISLMVGFTGSSQVFKGLSIVTNEQTYATTLVDNYIIPLNAGERDLSDVSCGATYGAKLVRDMVNEATEAVGETMYD